MEARLSLIKIMTELLTHTLHYLIRSTGWRAALVSHILFAVDYELHRWHWIPHDRYLYL